MRKGIPCWMTPKMCEVMMDHVDGTAPMTLDPVRLMAVSECIARDLLQFKEVRSFRPSNTIITEAGREALCIVLAEYADTLTQAVFEVEDVMLSRHQSWSYGSTGKPLARS